MGIWADLIGGSAVKIFQGVMDEIKLSPEKKAEMAEQVAALQAQAAQADKDFESKLNQIASDNIKTDSSSSDSFVRRARPYFLWIMATAIGCNLLFFPLVNLATGKGLTPLVIAPEYLSLYKAAFLGYVTARTAEKIMDKD